VSGIVQLHGVLPALISPLKQDGTADQPAIHRLVDHVIKGGVTGLVPLGSTGENASLDETTRRNVLKAVVEAAAGRVPVICGVAQTHIAAARAEVEAAARLGAAAALVAPGSHLGEIGAVRLTRSGGLRPRTPFRRRSRGPAIPAPLRRARPWRA